MTKLVLKKGQTRLHQSQRELMVARIMAHDICAIVTDIDEGRFDFITSYILGEGVMQPGKMTDKQLIQEWYDGDYDGRVKRDVVESSRAYIEFAYIQQLWDKGDMSGLHTDKGFFPVGSEEYKRSCPKN